MLYEFLIERQLLILDKEIQLKEEDGVISKKKWMNKVYVSCNFDMAILPIKLNLPMVYPPKCWKKSNDYYPDNNISNGDIRNYEGGYLCGVSPEFYNRFRLLSSQDYNNFKVNLVDSDAMCGVLNKLQKEVFEVNTKLLSFIKKNREKLEEEGLLMKRILSTLNPQDIFDIVRYCFNINNDVKKVTSLKTLLNDMIKWMQQSRYERIVLDIANAYEGYPFFLPAFLDFRGRIYRSGILHFHERDLSKSLIVFSSQKEILYNKDLEYELRMKLASAAAFKYKKFTTITESQKWYMEMYE